MGHHASDRQADVGALSLVIVPFQPFWILHNSLAPYFIESDCLCILSPRCSHRDDTPNEVGIFDRPLHDLHSAHGSSDHCIEPADFQVIEQNFLRANHIAYGDEWKSQVVGLASIWVDGHGAGRSLAPADTICAKNKKAISVDRFAWAYHTVPPSRFAVMDRMSACAMVVSRKSVGYENSVILFLI